MNQNEWEKHRRWPNNPMAPSMIQKRNQESVSLCTQSIIQQKGKHNGLRTEDGKIPRGCKVGGKTNLKRHLKGKQTALLFVWISQLTGMWCDQFLMTDIFKRWRWGRTGSAAQHHIPQSHPAARHRRRTSEADAGLGGFSEKCWRNWISLFYRYILAASRGLKMDQLCCGVVEPDPLPLHGED